MTRRWSWETSSPRCFPAENCCWSRLESGELESTVNLGRPLARSPVNDEGGPAPVPAGPAGLPVRAESRAGGVRRGDVSRPRRCVDSLRSGATGPVPDRPENDSLYNSRFHIMILDQDGAKVRPVQDVDVSGWTWQTPASAGPIVWGLGDKGGYEAFSVGDYASKTPFRSLARLTADSVVDRAGFRAGTLGSRALGGFGAFGTIRPRPRAGGDRASAPIVQPGQAMAPIQKAGKLLDHDVSGSAERRCRALGYRPRFERRGLEDDRRRALARAARWPAPRDSLSLIGARRTRGRARRGTDQPGRVPDRGGAQARRVFAARGAAVATRSPRARRSRRSCPRTARTISGCRIAAKPPGWQKIALASCTGGPARSPGATVCWFPAAMRGPI